MNGYNQQIQRPWTILECLIQEYTKKTILATQSEIYPKNTKLIQNMKKSQ